MHVISSCWRHMIIVRPQRHPGLNSSLENSHISTRSDGHKNQTKNIIFGGPKLMRSFDELHRLSWFSAPDSTPVRTWKVTQWMTLESPCAYRYHKDSWPKPAMKMQIRTFLLRQYRGLRRHLQKRVIILLSTVPRTEGALKNDQKCLKIQKVV